MEGHRTMPFSLLIGDIRRASGKFAFGTKCYREVINRCQSILFMKIKISIGAKSINFVMYVNWKLFLNRLPVQGLILKLYESS